MPPFLDIFGGLFLTSEENISKKWILWRGAICTTFHLVLGHNRGNRWICFWNMGRYVSKKSVNFLFLAHDASIPTFKFIVNLYADHFCIRRDSGTSFGVIFRLLGVPPGSHGSSNRKFVEHFLLLFSRLFPRNKTENRAFVSSNHLQISGWLRFHQCNSKLQWNFEADCVFLEESRLSISVFKWNLLCNCLEIICRGRRSKQSNMDWRKRENLLRAVHFQILKSGEYKTMKLETQKSTCFIFCLFVLFYERDVILNEMKTIFRVHCIILILYLLFHPQLMFNFTFNLFPRTFVLFN